MQELKTKVAQSKKKEQTQFGGILGKLSLYDDKSFNLLMVPTALGDELISFPDTVLASVAEYMTKTERALTAVAMTASSKSWRESNWQKEPSEASKVIIAAKPLSEIKHIYGSTEWKNIVARKKSYQWDFVDFEDIDRSLAAKLCDEDIGGVLVCIDAINTIKKFKLRGCVCIRGDGLVPLRGSLVLEQIDLSLAGSSIISGNESPLLWPPPALSESVVVPVLDSILAAEGSVLKHLQLPKKWREGQSTLLSQFLARYNEALNNRELACCHKRRYSDEPPCGVTCHNDGETPWVARDGWIYGIQQHSCYECNKQYCEEHEWMAGHTCEVCEKVFCMNCNETSICDMCFKATCFRCTLIGFCTGCEQHFCGDCCPVTWCDGCSESRCAECSPYLYCDHKECKQANCTECSDIDDDDDWAVNECSTCETSFCAEHLVSEISTRGEGFFCEECNERALTSLKKKNASLLDSVHDLEKCLGYEERFQAELESNIITKLVTEQTRIDERHTHLLSKLPSVEV